MKKKFQAYILRVLGVDAAIAKHNVQVEEYVNNSLDMLENELRNELADKADHSSVRDVERKIESLQAEVEEL